MTQYIFRVLDFISTRAKHELEAVLFFFPEIHTVYCILEYDSIYTVVMLQRILEGRRLFQFH